jgi:hypothetical protein
MSSDLNKGTFYNSLNQASEYEYNDRLDMVYVLQITFIAILSFIMMYYFKMMGFLSTFAIWILTAIIVVFVILIYLNRMVVTPKLHTGTDWDHLNFGDGTLLPPSGYTQSGIPGGKPGSIEIKSCTTTTTC